MNNLVYLFLLSAIGAVGFLSYSIGLFVRSWRWKYDFVHSVGKIIGSDEGPRRFVKVAFHTPEACAGVKPRLVIRESGSPPTVVIEEIYDDLPLETVEIRISLGEGNRISGREELEIMYPAGHPERAQLENSRFLLATACLLASCVFAALFFAVAGAFKSVGNLMIKN
jgi:hypothetical protein